MDWSSYLRFERCAPASEGSTLGTEQVSSEKFDRGVAQW